MPSIFLKDPNAVLDYKFDWKAETNGSGDSDWLDSDETISSKTVTVDSGITKDSDAPGDTNTSVVVWLSGGTAGVDYEVACKIVTSASRTDERTIKIQVRER
jgi:hypothetical protein